jgi:hypothetical protein
MRALLTCAILTVTALTVNSVSAQYSTDKLADLVDSWYVRYVGHHADPMTLSEQVRALRHGVSLDAVEASVLASPEYYVRSGATPEGYVAALNRDVLGRSAGPFEFNREVRDVLTVGRTAVAMQILNQRAIIATPIVVSSPPVIVTQAPVYVPSTVIVPSYRPAPVYVSPRPVVALRFSFR